MRAICAIVASLVLAGTNSHAIDIPVPPGSSINEAIDLASAGDVIVLSAGTYTESETINTQGKFITIRGVADQDGDGLPETILNGDNAYRVIDALNSWPYSTTFENLLIYRGASDFGAGMYATGTSGPTINNCVFKDNSAGNWGGGLYGYGSGATLTNCKFINNSAGDNGGGIFNQSYGNITLNDCSFFYNSSYRGGGISNADSDANINNCIFEGNSGGQGGGIFNERSDIYLEGCMINDNFATYGGGICSISNDVLVLTNCTVCGNEPDQIAQGWTDNGGNIVESECPQPTGACCVGTSCVEVSSDDCLVADGNYQGDASVCDDAPCGIPSGACCTNGDCIIGEEEQCLLFGGLWLGANSSCDDCPPPVEPEVLGACCINGACIPSTAEGCFVGGGAYAGDGVECEDAECPETCPGDLTGDSQVTIVDLLFVIEQWGVTCP